MNRMNRRNFEDYNKQNLQISHCECKKNENVKIMNFCHKQNHGIRNVSSTEGQIIQLFFSRCENQMEQISLNMIRCE